MRNEFACFDLPMAQELCRMGHRMTYVKPNKDESGRFVFYFSWDDEGLKEDVEELKMRRVKHHKI